MFSTGQADPQGHRTIYSGKFLFLLYLSGLSYLIGFFSQLVEDEEVIGTLIESNERIITALESYDKVGLPNVPIF
jgi:hypothetical protein